MTFLQKNPRPAKPWPPAPAKTAARPRRAKAASAKVILWQRHAKAHDVRLDQDQPVDRDNDLASEAL